MQEILRAEKFERNNSIHSLLNNTFLFYVRSVLLMGRRMSSYYPPVRKVSREVANLTGFWIMSMCIVEGMNRITTQNCTIGKRV